MPKRRSYKPGKFDFSVRRSRTGLGLFTNGPIEKGAVVIEYIGKTLTKEEYEATNSKYLFELGPRKTIDGAPRWNTARYINHSCAPNCTIDIHNRRAFIRARRAIKPGEELSYNYGKDYFDAYINGGCRCLKCQPPEGPPGVKSEIRVAKKKADPSRSRPRVAESESGPSRSKRRLPDSGRSPGRGSAAR